MFDIFMARLAATALNYSSTKLKFIAWGFPNFSMTRFFPVFSL
jgi:hypothetical protein